MKYPSVARDAVDLECDVDERCLPLRRLVQALVDHLTDKIGPKINSPVDPVSVPVVSVPLINLGLLP